MKLLAFFTVLTVVGGYPSPPAQDSHTSSTSTQIAASPSTDVPLTPRQNAETHADILGAQKDYLAAAHAYEDILRDDPRNARVLNKTGVAYQTLGDSMLAERYYKKALSVDKKFATALNNLGTIEYTSERYGRAIKYYRKALDVDPKRSTVLSNLGYAYAGNHQFAKALDAFGKALALDPDIFTRHGGNGPLIEQRTAADPGLLFFLLAKSFAKIGDAEHTVQYLKLARDDGYKNFAAAATDIDFKPVIQNPRVREALQLPPIVPPEAEGAGTGKTPS
jgi:tetratricopeptide (TPR) repeat protein